MSESFALIVRADRPKLTRRQADVLRLLQERPLRPTIRELATLLGVRSTNGVHQHLVKLEKKGFIRRSVGDSRAIRLLPRALLPFAGDVG